MQENLAMSHSIGEADREPDAATPAAASNLKRTLDDLAQQVSADPLLIGALASMGLALGLQLAGHSRAARFVGLWAPTLLLLDLYHRAAAPAGSRDARPRHDAGLDLDSRFEGGCAQPPAEWEETIDDGYRMTAARDPDDYSERISRVAPLKAK